MAEAFAMVATAVTATNSVTMIGMNFSAVHVVRSLRLTNVHTASTAAITVVVTKGNTASRFTFAAFTQVTCQQSIEALPNALVLGSSDTLQLECNPVTQVDAIISFLRIT
jgi:hypothetical protein